MEALLVSRRQSRWFESTRPVLRALIIFFAIFLAATRASAERPHFAIYRDHGRFHLVTDDLSWTVTENAVGGEYDGEKLQQPIIVKDSGGKFELNWHESRSKQYGNCYEFYGSLAQERDGHVEVSFWRSDVPDVRRARYYCDADAAYADPCVANLFAAALTSFDQCPRVMTADEVRCCFNLEVKPDAKTRDVMTHLISQLADVDPHVRYAAVRTLSRYAAYLPAAVGDGRGLCIEQRIGIGRVLGNLKVCGTKDLLWVLREEVCGR